MAGTLVVPVVDEGLGNSAYLVDLGDGRALAVDVPRDLRVERAAARQHRLMAAFAADTHLHADFLSGAPQLAAEDGAQILASAAGHRPFGHWRLADGDEADLGGLTLRAWATPGHTAEHLAYLLLDGGQLLGVFTGGSLLVGAAARTDLSGPEQAEALARSQYASLGRLLTLPDVTPVYPTHGAGSFCSAPSDAQRTTTIGGEKAANPLLAAGDEDAFVAALLASLGTFPGYFLRLPEENRRGPAVVPATPVLTPLTPAQQKIWSTVSAHYGQQTGYPFIDFGNKIFVMGPSYSPYVIEGLDQSAIAAKLKNPNDPVTQGIVGTSNYLTAAICSTTSQKPASVCTAPATVQASKAMGLSS